MKRLLLLCLLLFSNSFAVGFADRLFMSDGRLLGLRELRLRKPNVQNISLELRVG